MLRTVTAADLELLARIQRGEGPIPSNHVVRLEILGLIRDTVDGRHLTPKARALLARGVPTAPESARPEPVEESADAPARRNRGSKRSANSSGKPIWML